MSDERTFPVLWQGDRAYLFRLQELGCPRTVPWAFIEQYRDGCLRNHDQTPERLAQRGGLSPAEIVAVIYPESRKQCWLMTADTEVARLKDLLAAWGTRSVP